MPYTKCPNPDCLSDVDWRNTDICPYCGYNILTPIISSKKTFQNYIVNHTDPTKGNYRKSIYLPEIDRMKIFKETLCNGSFDGINIEYTFDYQIANYGNYSGEEIFTNRICCINTPKKTHQYAIPTKSLIGYQKRICVHCDGIIRGTAPEKCPHCGKFPWKEKSI